MHLSVTEGEGEEQTESNMAVPRTHCKAKIDLKQPT